MINELFAVIKSMPATINCLQHIESLMMNVIHPLGPETKDEAIDAVVKLLESNKNKSELPKEQV